MRVSTNNVTEPNRPKPPRKDLTLMAGLFAGTYFICTDFVIPLLLQSEQDSTKSAESTKLSHAILACSGKFFGCLILATIKNIYDTHQYRQQVAEYMEFYETSRR